MGRPGPTLTVLAAVFALCLSACGSADGGVETGSDTPGGSETGTGIGQDLRVFCGGVEFEGRSIDLGALPIFSDTLANFVPEGFVEEFDLQWEEGLKDLTLHEVERTPTIIHLLGWVSGVGENSGGYQEIRFVLEGDQWEFDTWGGCIPQVVVDGYGISELALDPAQEPTAESTEIALLVTERECASGQLPEGREIVPVVIENAETIQVIVLIEDLRGGARCPSNPSFPTTVNLAAPLGDRSIENIAFEPAHELVWPIPLRPAETRIEVFGESPQPQTVNVVVAEGGDYPSGLMLSERGWSDFGNSWVTSYEGENAPASVRGFVAACETASICNQEECPAGGDGAQEMFEEGFVPCADLERLGAECVATFAFDPKEDAQVIVTYAENECSIEVVRTRIE